MASVTPSQEIRQVAAQWEQAYTQAPDKTMNFLGEVVRNSGKYFAPAAEAAGGGWVMTKAGQNAWKAFQGQNVPGFKASTSNTDAAMGTVLYTVTALVGAGMTVHGALQIVGNLAADIEKSAR